MSNNTLKYIGLATVAAGAAYGGYKYGRTLLNKVTELVTKKETTEEVVEETSQEVKSEVQEETVADETAVESKVEEVVQTETQEETITEEAIKIADEVIDNLVNGASESETESVIETPEEAEETYEPTSLEEAIQCFAKLLLLEDEGMEVQDIRNEYCDTILVLKKERGLNAKAFKAVVKRAGLLPNSHEWTRLFSGLRQYELQMASYEEA